MSLNLTSFESVEQYLIEGNEVDKTLEPETPIDPEYYLPKTTLAALCVEHDEAESLDLLIKNGCSVSGLLFRAIYFNSTKCVEVLLKNSVNIDEVTKTGISPAAVAAKKDRFDLIRLLAKHGADLSLPLIDNETIPLTYAAAGDYRTTAACLLEAHSPTSSLSTKSSPLMTAIARGNSDLALMLIQYGADPNLLDQQIKQPIDCAVEANNLLLVHLLLAVGSRMPSNTGSPFSQNVQEIMNFWKTQKITEGLSGFDTPLPSLKEEIASLKKKVEELELSVEGIDFEHHFVTPILNLQHSVVSAFMKALRRIDSYAKDVFRIRTGLISKQIKYVLSIKNKDKAKRDTEDDSTSKTAENEESEKLESFTSSNSQPLQPVFDEQLNVARICRGKLIHLNNLNSMFKELLLDLYNLIIYFKKLNDSIYIREIDRLSHLKQIARENMKAAQSQPELKDEFNNISIDLAFIEDEREKFLSISSRYLRCLRYSFQ